METERGGAARAEAAAGLPDLGALDGIPLAAVATDVDGRIFYFNGAARQLYGHREEDLLREPVLDVLVQADDQQPALDILTSVLAGGVWSGEFDVARPDGSTVRAHVDDVPIWQDGRVVGVLGFGREVTDPAETGNARRLSDLGRITAELAGAPDVDTVARVVTRHAADAIGADMAGLAMTVAPGTLRLLGLRGATPGAYDPEGTFSVDAATPMADAARTQRLVVVIGREELDRRYPGLIDGDSERSLAAMPLMIQDRCVGAVGLSFGWRKPLEPDEHTFLRTLADTTAQALERLNAAAAADNRARQLAFLAEATVELASSLDYETTLTNVARLALGELADWVAVELLDDGELRPVVTMHVDPDKIALAEELRRRYPGPADASTGVTAVVRTGISELYEHIPEQLLVQSAVDEDHLTLIRELKLRSAMIVALTVRDRTLGAMVLVSSADGRAYTAADLSLAEDLARRAAVAIDNSQLHSQMLEASLRLQRAVLPARLESTARWQFAAHYRPAGRTEVGGDFYDALALPDGRAVAVVGDVMGRGVDAAAAMAQVRAAVRAYVAVDSDPVFVLDRLTQMFETYRISGLVTVTVALADPAEGELRIASAGHLPPVARLGAAAPRLLDVPTSPPLGAGSFPRSAASFPFASPDALLLYSDGLVEDRHEDIDTGMGRLVAALAEDWPGTDADLARLASTVTPPAHDDDVTLLSVALR